MRLAAGKRGRQHLRSYAFTILMCVSVTCVLSIGASEQGARDAPGQSGRCPRFIGRHVLTQRAQQVIAWISVEGFSSGQFGQSRFETGQEPKPSLLPNDGEASSHFGGYRLCGTVGPLCPALKKHREAGEIGWEIVSRYDIGERLAVGRDCFKVAPKNAKERRI